MMAEDNATAPTEGTAPEGSEATEGAVAPKKRRMLLIMSVMVAIVGILVAVGVVFFIGGEKKKADAPHTDMPMVAIYDVPEFNLSLLSDDPTAQHFIKIKMSLELANAGDSAAMDKLLPKLQDDWGGFLRQMRITDLQGSANLQRLKEGLLRRANQSLDPVAVKAVYIRELLIQ